LQLLVNIILVVNVFVCVALVCVVLLQRSEGGALGMGGGGGPSGFMTARGAGDLLTRTTWILAFVFFFLSITETVLTGKLHGGVSTLVDHINTNSIDLSAPAKPGAAPALPGAAPSSAPPALQAPAPQLQTPQAPAQPSGADALSAFSVPAPAPKGQTPPGSAQAPQKK
jgi:preprotein translocase subunit SecG